MEAIKNTRFLRVIGIKSLYLNTLDNYQISPESLSFPKTLMNEDMALIPSQALSLLYSELLKLSKDQDFVFNAYKDLNNIVEDPFDGWLFSCQDLSTLIWKLNNVINRIQTGAFLSIINLNKYSKWSYENPFIAPEVRSHDNIRALFVMISILRSHFDKSYKPLKIILPHSLLNIKKYEDYFGCKIEHSSSRVEVWIESSDYVKYNMDRKDKAFVTLRTKELKTLLEIPSPDDQYSTFCELINYCRYMGFPTLEMVANLLSVSEQALQRFCKKNGVSFSQIRGDVLSNISLYMLRNGDDINSISKRLGYEQTNSFNRMFKKHKGMTPKSYQNEYIQYKNRLAFNILRTDK
tara:strand:+ start:4162 stop:5211 length:1050 start_codon:yes stop_codon:yes gene_type:complete